MFVQQHSNQSAHLHSLVKILKTNIAESVARNTGLLSDENGDRKGGIFLSAHNRIDVHVVIIWNKRAWLFKKKLRLNAKLLFHKDLTNA